MLIAARILQAIGAAMVVPTSLALLLPEFPITERATAVGLWAASAGVASAAGPVLGGLLIHWQGWPAIFLANLPIGAGARFAGRRILHEARAPQPAALPDFVGAILLAGAVALTALTIVQSPVWGWTGPPTVAVGTGTVLLATVFLRRSAIHDAPVVPVSLLRIRSFALANAGSLIFSAGFFARLLCDVFFLTGAWRYSTLTAGLATTASTHPDFVRLWLPGSILAGLGVGVGMTTFSSAAAASLPAHLLGVGGAVNITARQIGAVLGVAILVAIIGTPGSIHDVSAFRDGWLFSVLAAVIAASIALCLGRIRLAAQTLAAREAGALPATGAGNLRAGARPPRLLRNDDDLGYLLRVLRNTYLTSRRTASRRPHIATTLERVHAAHPRTDNQPEHSLASREVYASIAELPESFRLALVAIDIAGLSYREAARALRVPEATITTRLHRARQRIAIALREPRIAPNAAPARQESPRDRRPTEGIGLEGSLT